MRALASDHWRTKNANRPRSRGQERGRLGGPDPSDPP